MIPTRQILTNVWPLLIIAMEMRPVQTTMVAIRVRAMKNLLETELHANVSLPSKIAFLDWKCCDFVRYVCAVANLRLRVRS